MTSEERANGGIKYPRLADAVAEYRSATAFLRVDSSHTRLHQQAVDIITQTGHVFYEVDCTCVICAEEYTQMFPLSAIASWSDSDKPRGACRRCDVGATATVVRHHNRWEG